MEDNALRAQASLIVLDPFSAFLSGDVDGYKDQEIRKIMTMLATLADRCRCAVVLIRHLGKGDKSNSLYRGLGSDAMVSARIDSYDRNRHAAEFRGYERT